MNTSSKQSRFSFMRVYPWVLVIGGVLGLLAAGILTVEKLHLAANPTYQPSCSISPIVACSPVIASKQASAFGFPNPLIGIAGFAMVWAVGMMLLAGAGRLNAWFWQCFMLGTAFGIGFSGWLIHEALYDIGKLCLYCNLVWVVTIPIFWTTLTYVLRERYLKLPESIASVLRDHPGKWIALTYLALAVLIFTRFSEYWYSLL